MIHKCFTSCFILLCSAIIVTACDAARLPQLPGLPAKETPGVIITQAAQTISADQTRRARTNTPTIRPTRQQRTPTVIHTVILTPSDTPESTPLPTALFSDDFSGNTGWAISDHEDYSFGLAKGGYFIFVGIPKATIWSAKSIEVKNIQLQTQATRLEGPDNGYYGVMCRQQRDGFNYYVLVISSDGAYGIGKVINGTLQFIQEDVDQSGIIYRGEGSNQITGTCIDNKLTLLVNGKKILEVLDNQFTSGTIGLVAGLHKGEGLYVLFDFFIAREP